MRMALRHPQQLEQGVLRREQQKNERPGAASKQTRLQTLTTKAVARRKH